MNLPRSQHQFLAGILAAHSLIVAGAVIGLAEEAKHSLPLKRVVMLNSGVGYFEHSGQIEGDQTVEFPVKLDDINDLLKSLVVQDRGKGRVAAVTYGSPEPVSETLKSLAIDVTRNPSLAQIFHQLRGHKIELTLLSGAKQISGTIVGVERRHQMTRDQQVIDNDLILIRTEEGLRSLAIDSISLTRFADPKTDREFQQALDLLAGSRKLDRKFIKLDFRGNGVRDVSVGYIQESPIWKTSYRLVISKGKAPFLQGWAIVENTTAQDWNEVDLTLLSGRPVSFRMDLYQPLFTTRPMAELELNASVQPRRHNQDLAGREDEFLAAGRQAATNLQAGRGVAGQPGMAGMGGPAAYPNAAAGGMGGGMWGMGGMGGGMAGSMGGMGGAMGGFGGGGPAVDTKAVRNPMDLAQGVTSAANADDVGESFRYTIKTPVTLGRNESSMLPIINDSVKGEKIYLFNSTAHAKHPLAGLKLTNSSGLHLQQGPITVFEEDEYAGDAQIADIPPDSTRLITFALDLDTEVVATTPGPEQVLIAMSIRSGGLILKHLWTRKSQYLVKNSGRDPKSMLIERPVDAEWPNVTPKPAEKTRDFYRFSMTAEPCKPATLSVVETKDVVDRILVTTLEPAQINIYIRSDRASVALQNALKQLVTRKTDLDSLTRQRTAIEQLIRDETTEQQRLRENLKSASETEASELRERYVNKLAASEDTLEALRQKLASARTDEEQSKKDFEKFASELTVE